MPLKEAVAAPVAEFAVGRPIANETQSSDNRRQTRTIVGFNASDVSKVKAGDADYRLGVTAGLDTTLDAAGKALSRSRALRMTAFDKEGNPVGFFQTGSFATLALKLKDGKGLHYGTTTVVASDGLYANWNGAQTEVNYQGYGDAANLKGIKIIGNN